MYYTNNRFHGLHVHSYFAPSANEISSLHLGWHDQKLFTRAYNQYHARQYIT